VIIWNITDSFNYAIHRWRGKFSNESVMFQMITPWAIAPRLLKSDEKQRRVFMRATGCVQRWTIPWEIPLYTALTVLLARNLGADNDISALAEDVRKQLYDYPASRQRARNSEDPNTNKIVPIAKRKPGSWLWKNNPFQEYNIGQPPNFEEESYPATDWITAYNFAVAAGLLKGSE
jgi:hypothetical protein